MSGKSLTFAPVFRNNIKNNYIGMHSKDELKDITHFLLEYAGRLMGSGVHTSRVVRNTHRIGQSLDVEVAVSVIQKNLIVNVRDPQTRESYTEMDTTPAFPISFELNA